MERPSKRARMSLPIAPHPVAALLDDALKAFFLKRAQKRTPLPKREPFNQQKELKELNAMTEAVATLSDGSLYSELPSDLQGLVRKYTPHPVSLLLKEARFVWYELRHIRNDWPREQDSRIRCAEAQHDKEARVAHFDWLQDRGNRSAWSRAGVTTADILYEDEYDRGYENYHFMGF